MVLLWADINTFNNYGKHMAMKLNRLFVPVMVLVVLAGCDPLKRMHTHQDSIKESFNADEYNQVLTAYNDLENFHESRESEVNVEYTMMAAKSAVALEQYDQAEELLNQVIDETNDFEAIQLLGGIYEKTGNTNKEYEHWNRYFDEIESEELKKEIGQRLYSIEMENEEYEKALNRAQKMPSMTDPKLMFMRVEALEKTDKKEKAREVCDELLDKHPDFEPAMDWKAEDIFHQAEEWYQAELEEYDENPDYTAYVYLRRELKKISSMFRESRDIFEKLHQNNPDNKKYIQYLKNIYLRLDMEEEAAKMDMLLDNQR